MSIVVPTYCRKEHLFRTLDFISNYNFGHVIVVDGTPRIDLSKEIASRFPRVTYIHSEAGLVHRIAMIIPLIHTEYVAMWADDEYWLPSFFSSAMEFLRNNPDYVHCIGLAVSFSTSPSIGVAPQYSELRCLQLFGKTPASRLYSRFRNYVWGGLWGLARTSSWANSWRTSAAHEFPIRGATEIQFEAGMAWQGGTKVLQELAWFRSSEASSIDFSTDVSLNRANPMFHEWWIDASPFEQRRFIESFQSVFHLEPQDFKAFERALKHYSISVVSPGLISRILRLTRILVNSVFLPAFSFVKHTTRKGRTQLAELNLVVQLEIEDFLGLSLDENQRTDLKRVLNSLTTFVAKK